MIQNVGLIIGREWKQCVFSWSMLSQGGTHGKTKWPRIRHFLTDSPHQKVRSQLPSVWEWQLVQRGSQPSLEMSKYPLLQWCFLGTRNQGVSVNTEDLAGRCAIKILCLDWLTEVLIRVAQSLVSFCRFLLRWLLSLTRWWLVSSPSRVLAHSGNTCLLVHCALSGGRFLCLTLISSSEPRGVCLSPGASRHPE